MKFILLVFALQTAESKKSLRVIGGRDALADEYPYVARIEVLILSKNEILVAHRAHVCSSAIITPDWTLTAAHCVDEMSKLIKTISHMHNQTKNTQLLPMTEMKTVVWFGRVTDVPSKEAYSDILYGIMHPAAIFGLQASYPRNDVGLYRTQPIKINQYAKLSAVDVLSLNGHEIDLVGYGLTKSGFGHIADTLVLQKPLQILKAMIIKCDAKSPMYPVICIARPCAQSSTLCSGDSGGPVMHASGITAVNSMARLSDCYVSDDEDRSYYVGRLTPISPYIDWISYVIRNNNTDDRT